VSFILDSSPPNGGLFAPSTEGGEMSRERILKKLSELIVAAKQSSPLRVGIDGIDAAGKTRLANELVPHLEKSGCTVVRASIDGFHNSKQIRHSRGQFSAEGYYYDSFNYELLKELLLKPFGPAGNRQYRLSAFDFKTESKTHVENLQARDTDILLFDGVFLFRPGLDQFWDLKIFVEIDFQTSLERALERDIYLFGDQKEILRRYKERYIPGQQIYLETAQPKSKADILVENNDFTKPRIIFRRKKSIQVI
jgi:uridine kinase